MTILAYTGLRWSELVGLRVKDIGLAARRLYVRRAAPEVEGSTSSTTQDPRGQPTHPAPPGRRRHLHAAHHPPQARRTGRYVSERAPRDCDSGSHDRTRTGQIPLTTECKNRVDAGQTWWSRLGSNQRPSACEAERNPKSRCLRCSSWANWTHLGGSEHSIQMAWRIRGGCGPAPTYFRNFRNPATVGRVPRVE